MAYNATDNSELRKLQLHELELLKIFKNICDTYQLRYFMIGGTMLGAVRHQGFIPWDDDVDIGMPRKDYQRFLKVAARHLPKHIQLMNYKTTPGYLRYFSRLTDTNVRVYNASNTEEQVENAWVDIFPLDGMPSTHTERAVWFAYLCKLRVEYHFSCFDQLVNLNRPGRPAYQQMIIDFGSRVHIGRDKDTKELLDKIDRKLRRYPYDESEMVMNFFGAYVQKEIVPRRWFGAGRAYAFEDVMLRGPRQKDVYLRNFYGDYMQVPEDADKDKHNITRIEYVTEDTPETEISVNEG